MNKIELERKADMYAIDHLIKLVENELDDWYEDFGSVRPVCQLDADLDFLKKLKKRYEGGA